MLRLLRLAAMLSILLAVPASAAQITFLLHSHPNGNQNPPPYGLRVDNLLSSGVYTFDFDYSDMNETAEVFLVVDDALDTIHIFGRAYGGKDTGTGYDAVESGWIDIDFTYRMNVLVNVEDENGGAGDDFYSTNQDVMNNGTITLDGWGGDLVYSVSDKYRAADGFSFQFDNDEDSKGNASIINDPDIWSGAGWLMPPDGTRDWLFIGELMTPLATEPVSWGALKQNQFD